MVFKQVKEKDHYLQLYLGFVDLSFCLPASISTSSISINWFISLFICLSTIVEKNLAYYPGNTNIAIQLTHSQVKDHSPSQISTLSPYEPTIVGV